MNFSPIGDIAQSLMMRRRGNSLRQELSALTQELASGKSRDLAGQLRGNFSTISAVEHSIKLHDGYAIARNTASQVLNFSQQALGSMHALVDDIGTPLLAAITTGTDVQTGPFVARGSELFAELVGFANTQHAGRFVFAGNDFGTKPVADADTIMSELATLTAGMTSAVDVSSAIDDWFETAGSGYQATGYLGGAQISGAMDISSSQSVTLDLTANDQVFRDSFKHAATLALIERGEFAGGEYDTKVLLTSAATGLIDASKGLITAQADIGASQQRLDAAASQASLEVQMLQTVRNDITSVDPFDVATKLEAAQTQLESLYLVTARTSRLNLSEYLR